MNNFNIEVNHKTIKAQLGDTVLQTLRKNGINVPTICNMKDFSPTGACRLCVVEVEGKEHLIPSCSHPVEEWMKIQTHSPRVLKARRTIIELLLSNHPDDCLYCVRNQECELQNYAKEMHIIERRILGNKSKHKIDNSSISIVKDPAKCIICSRCVRVCEEVMMTSTFDFSFKGNKTYISTTCDLPISHSNCISCGQCVMVCPTAALQEQSAVYEVLASLHDKGLKTVVQVDPSVPLTIANELGIKNIPDFEKIIYSALRKIGFHKVYDTSFAHDIMILELAEELNQRLNNKKNLPLITNCCPSWVRFIEQFYPDLLQHLSGCKSHQQIAGTLIKKHLSEIEKIPFEKIVSVAIMPCTSRKYESGRTDHYSNNNSEVNFVLTTRELIRLIKMNGLDLNTIEPEEADHPLSSGSSLARLQGFTGTTMNSILQTVFYQKSGKIIENKSLFEFDNFSEGFKTGKIKTGNTELNVAVINGLKNSIQILESIRNKRSNLDLIEVMACYGGCICGGGQPFSYKEKEIRNSLGSLPGTKNPDSFHTPFQNQGIHEITDKIIGKPMSEINLKLFHNINR